MKRIGSSSKKGMMGDLKNALIGVAGGIAANQASTALEKSSVLGSSANLSPAIVAAAALAGYLFLPEGPLKQAAYGAMIVSGTEQTENLTSGLLAGNYTLGFTPQIIPEQFGDKGLKQVGGIPVK